MKKTFFLASILGVGAALWFFMQPTSYGTRLKGFVTAIFTDDNGDILIKMSSDRHIFRIYKGIDLGIDIKKLKTRLIGQESIIYFTHPRWPVSSTPYITRLISNGNLVYTKW